MARKKVDKLAQDVHKAIEANMSYGRWMAMQPQKNPKDGIPEGWKVCPYCKKPFKPVQGKKYCEAWCREQAYKPRAREIQNAYHAKRKEYGNG